MGTSERILRFVANRYLKKPELADMLVAKYPSLRAMLKLAYNQCGYLLRMPGLASLVSVTVEPTNRCNMRCITCPVNRGMKRTRGDMEMLLFKKIVNENPGLELIAFIGWGEPLLNPGTLDMVRYAGGRGIRTLITTNGTLLDEKTRENIINSPLDVLAISIDGDDEAYRAIRSVSLDGVMDNTRELADTLKKAGKGPRLIVRAVATEENEERLAEFLKSIDALVSGVQVQPCLLNVRPGYAKKRLKKSRVCHELFKGDLTVYWDGTVVACCADYEASYPLGDARQKPLAKIIRGERAQRLKRSILDGRFMPMCRYCTEYQTPLAQPRFY